MRFSLLLALMLLWPTGALRRACTRRTVKSSSLMQNPVPSLFSVIPAQAEIQKVLIYHVFISWTPASAGATVLFASSC